MLLPLKTHKKVIVKINDYPTVLEFCLFSKTRQSQKGKQETADDLLSLSELPKKSVLYGFTDAIDSLTKLRDVDPICSFIYSMTKKDHPEIRCPEGERELDVLSRISLDMYSAMTLMPGRSFINLILLNSLHDFADAILLKSLRSDFAALVDSNLSVVAHGYSDNPDDYMMRLNSSIDRVLDDAKLRINGPVSNNKTLVMSNDPSP